jgi:hypothetical protein
MNTCIRCIHCGVFVPIIVKYDDDVSKSFVLDESFGPVHNCEPVNDPYLEMDDDDVVKHIKCYTCGGSDVSNFTKSQVKKYITKTICNTCIDHGIVGRYAPYVLDIETIDEQLFKAISDVNIEKVKELLSNGANPNCMRQETIRHPYTTHYPFGRTWFKIWLHDKITGETRSAPEYDPYGVQATTPLKMVSFVYCGRNDAEKAEIRNITKILIEAGADVSTAITYHNWYSDEQLANFVDNDNTPFEIIYTAYRHIHN